MFSHSLKVDSYMVFSLKILQNFTGSLSYFRLLEVIKLNLIVEKTELFRNDHDKFKCKMASGCQRCFHFLNLSMNELLFVVVAH